MNIDEKACWIAISGLRKWKKNKLNEIIRSNTSITDVVHDNRILYKYAVSEQEREELDIMYSGMADYKKIAGKIEKYDIKIIPLTSKEYPGLLLKNFKPGNLPPVIYIKGNVRLFKEKSVAIVGSRNASQKALEFTDNIAKLASGDYKVIVSGFAKGVDRQALDSAIKHKGQSIIVLPQGILTFKNTSYREIINNGDVVLFSAFYPEAAWSVKLAMARNPIIYGLAEEIFVAESAEKGGTWAGVIDGLRKGRKIFVRKAGDDENNSNKLLIKKGALAVDFNGKVTGYNKERETADNLREDNNNRKQKKLF